MGTKRCGLDGGEIPDPRDGDQINKARWSLGIRTVVNRYAAPRAVCLCWQNVNAETLSAAIL